MENNAGHSWWIINPKGNSPTLGRKYGEYALPKTSTISLHVWPAVIPKYLKKKFICILATQRYNKFKN